MGQIGMDISVEELRRQFRDAVERLAEQRADLDQATREVTRLRGELEEARQAHDYLDDVYKKASADATSSADQAMRLRKELEELREQYAVLEKGLSEGMAQRAADKLHQETMNALVGEFAEDAEKLKQARQKLEGAEEVFRLIRVALYGHNKEGDIVQALKDLRIAHDRLREELEGLANLRKDETKKNLKYMEQLQSENTRLREMLKAAKKFNAIWQDIDGAQAGLETAGDELEAAIAKAELTNKPDSQPSDCQAPGCVNGHVEVNTISAPGDPPEPPDEKLCDECEGTGEVKDEICSCGTGFLPCPKGCKPKGEDDARE